MQGVGLIYSILGAEAILRRMEDECVQALSELQAITTTCSSTAVSARKRPHL